ncbi:MAG: YdcH family protein [Alphaproteobacteria bacterium]|nr:YdcH family protein [Alphaproteobacteria bacterium]
MAHTPHELAEEFPEHTQKIHDLKSSDAHFARLADEYHTINRTIHRAESGAESVADSSETDMRKQRMKLKDEIAGILSR